MKKNNTKSHPLLQVFLLLLFISSMNISCNSKKNKAASYSNDDEYVVKRNGINEDENKEDNTNDRTRILNITKPTTFKVTFMTGYYEQELFFTFYTDGTCEYYNAEAPEHTWQGQWQLCERSIKEQPFRAIIIIESTNSYLGFTEGGSYLRMNGNEVLQKGVEHLDDLLLVFYTKEQRNKEAQKKKNGPYGIFTVVK